MADAESHRVVIRERESRTHDGNFVIELHRGELCFRLAKGARGIVGVDRQRAFLNAARIGKKIADSFDIPLFVIDTPDKKERRLVFT